MLYAGVAAVSIKQRYRIPFVVTEHNSAFARNLLSARQLSLAAQIAAAADKKFAVSQDYCDVLGRMLPSDDVWECVPNIVAQPFADLPLKKRARNPSQFSFINVATATDNKKQTNIIKAFANEFASNADVSLKIVGDGPEIPALRDLVAHTGLGSRVELLGALSRSAVLSCVASADAFVLASQYETFGVAVVEALALGKPVVATRCGGPESIVRKQDGLLVPVDDVVRLGKAMTELYERREQFDPVQIRQGCLARYGERAVARKLLNSYADVARSRCE
jgi:glycosyltransferase involved in cell wall biosynthesis